MRSIDPSLSYAAKWSDQPPEKAIEDASAPVAKQKCTQCTLQHVAYRPSADLARVVDLATALGRPLLLQGEPGCGKTRLAFSLAYTLGLPLEVAYVKSTSRAQDLLYGYDAVRRLYDAQLGAKGPTRKGQPLARHAASYITLGPLGKAIQRGAYGRRTVVLIDEIDKADLDFPNDLLWELDRMEFGVPEAPELGARAGDVRPLVVITHNEEKPLPPAFLRRCVYHYVEFPRDRAEVEEILALNGVTDAALRTKAAEVHERLRTKELNKRPGLTELIDWAWIQQERGTPPAALDGIPDPEALLKDRADQERVRKDTV